LGSLSNSRSAVYKEPERLIQDHGAKEAEQWREASVSTDVDAKGPLPDIRF